jgi:hypothetical protein
MNNTNTQIRTFLQHAALWCVVIGLWLLVGRLAVSAMDYEVAKQRALAAPALKAQAEAQMSPVGDTPLLGPDLASGEAVEASQKAVMARVTWFSSAECQTSWCQANAGRPRGRRVALNPKFGHASKVYVPAWGKTYDVIGTTDANTDLDVWCEGDEACQQSVGSRTLLINLID